MVKLFEFYNLCRLCYLLYCSMLTFIKPYKDIKIFLWDGSNLKLKLLFLKHFWISWFWFEISNLALLK